MNASQSDSVAQASLPAGYGSIPAPSSDSSLGRDAQGTRTLGSARYHRVGIFPRPTLRCSMFLLFLIFTFCASALASVNPYVSTITNRNLFSLKPPVDPASLVPQAPPPALPGVKLAGITTLLGGKRAILRVARPARPPFPAGDESLMLAEGGPEESGVKVLEINIAAATVRILNHGSPQTLDLEKDAPKSAPAPVAPAIPAPGQPGGAIPVPQPAVVPGVGVPSVARPIRGAGPMAAANNSTGVPGAGPSGIAQPEAPKPLSLEEQEVLIELNRERDAAAVASGDLPPYPPTDLGSALNDEQQAEQSAGGPPKLF